MRNLFVQAKPDWILIPYEDLSIPIPKYRDESYGIVRADGTGKPATVSDTWNRDHLGLEWSPSHYLVFVENFNGDCADDILLQAKRPGGSSYIVLTNCSGQVPTGSTVHTLAPGHLGLNWDAGSYAFVVGDFDGNGRADIYMQATTPSSTNRVAYTDNTGNVTSTPSTHAPSGNFKKPVPGAIPGSFAVGDQGAGTYSIPIATPAATGGLKPNLALTYNHLAGNGLAGMRWNLSGISAITRCQQTFGQDEATVAITYTNSDRFCMNGQRLLTLAGSHGADGTEYRTELDTVQRIVQNGTQGGGPQAFRVDHGNGMSSYFGATADSRVEVTGGSAVRIWFVSYTEDRFGNRINYAYNENGSTGETVPTEVAWTQNSGQSLTAKYKVAITYEGRPADDQRSGYDSAGRQWATTSRIDKIDVLYNAQLINSYDLSYAAASSAGTGRSRLEQVAVCGPTECLPPTVFTTQNGTRGWGGLTNTTRAWGGFSTYPRVGDMNGDGKEDIFFVGPSNTWQVYLGNSSGLLDAVLESGVAVGPNPFTARVIDYDSDGRSDLLYKSSTVWRVLRHNGTSFIDSATTISTSNPTHANIRDFDGDGLRDWIYRDGFNIKWLRNTGTSFYPAGTLASIDGYSLFYEHPDRGPDFNGDGRDDLVNLGNYCEYWEVEPYELCTPKWTVLVANGAGYAVHDELQGGFYDDAIGSVLPLDVNGDGLDDIVYGGVNYGWVVRLSTGSGFGTGISTGIPFTSGQAPFVADYDNDGREDLIVVDGDYWRIYRSNGSTYPSYTDSLYSPGALAANTLVADLSGDGYDDIVRVSGTTWHTHKHQTALPDVVTTFTDGLGYAVGVQYESLSNTASYTIDTSQIPPWPYTRYRKRTGYVVTAENHDNGIGGTHQLTHSYETAYMDVSGRNWSSFKRHRVNDVARGTHTITEFRQTFPLVGMVTKQELRRTSDGQLIRQVEQSLLGSALAGAPGWFPRVESRTIREYEIEGPATGTHLRTIVEDPTYHETYGYVTDITQTVTDPVSTEQWTSVTNFNRTQYTTPWCLGLPGLVQTTNMAPGQPSAVRKLRYTFNSSNCTLSDTKDESESNTAKQLATTYSYDGYGTSRASQPTVLTPLRRIVRRRSDMTETASSRRP
jgi:hypothetical protein